MEHNVNCLINFKYPSHFFISAKAFCDSGTAPRPLSSRLGNSTVAFTAVLPFLLTTRVVQLEIHENYVLYTVTHSKLIYP
jgi:hypothetical protein